MTVDLVDNFELKGLTEAARGYVDVVVGEMGERLRGALLLCPVARGASRVAPDIDLIMIVRGPVPRRIAGAGPVAIHALWRSPDDVLRLAENNFDIAADGIVLLDLDGLLARTLENVRGRLRAHGARRVWIGATQLWQLQRESL